jgi:predicted alpha-1,2-mannosidase
MIAGGALASALLIVVGGVAPRPAGAVTGFQPPCPAPISSDPAAYVCPLIATSNSADDFPGADAPFGMVQWSPDTTTRPAGGGYEYNDSQINGFSLTHISGPGCGAGGDIPILPWAGPVADANSIGTVFQHTDESVSPGYYQVLLSEPGESGTPSVKTELTATQRSGLGRFTFPAGTQSNLLLNLYGSQMHVTGASATTVGTSEVTGWAAVGGPGGNGFCGESDRYKVYFSLEFSRPITGCGLWNGGSVTPGNPQSGCTAGDGGSSLYVTFDTMKDPVVLARVGLSYVSTANALSNAQTEDPGGLSTGGFDTVRSNTYQAWNSLLGRIRVTGGSTDERVVFYTALYHALLHPNVFSDVNGQYPGFATYSNSANENTIYTAPRGHAQYANFSGWDVYRTEMQLIALVAPAVGSDIAQSMLNDYAQGGTLPKWSLNNGESYVMDGDPSEAMLADLYAFGATKFDTKAALAAMIAQATQPNFIRPGMNYYDSLHYEPADGNYGCCWWGGSVSTTQEYAIGDDAIAQFATALRDTVNAKKFLGRAQNWEYTFNPNGGMNGFAQEKYADGQFMTPFVPTYGNTVLEGGFTEGDAYQYTPMVNFNVHALANAMGGNAAYAQYLDGLTAAFGDPGGDLNAPVTGPGAGTVTNYVETQSIFGGGLLPFAWLGNEPAVEVPWEYDFVGAPYRAQDVVRRVAVEIYTNSPTGMPGNDDLGTMSAALVWEDLGIYPIVPGSATLALASSLFTSATIQLPSGKTLTISAPKASDSNRYIQSMTVNGQTWNAAYLPPSVLQKGGTIVENLGGSPNTAWAAGPSAAPPSYPTGQLPGIGFTMPSGLIPANPGGYPVTLGVQNVTDQSLDGVRWTATASPGVTVKPAQGTIAVPA